MKNEGEKKKHEEEKGEESFDLRSSLAKAYISMSNELIQTQQRDKEKKKEILREGIERIEKKAKKELKSSKLLVEKILEIRSKAGLSSTIGTAGKVKKPVFGGKGDFKDKLKQEILLIGTQELNDFGGAISLAKFIDYFKETRSNWKIKTGDIIGAIRELEKDKVIPSELEIGENEVLIRFKPLEVSNDFRMVLQLATGLEYLTVEMLTSHLGWSKEHAKDTLSYMAEKGIAIEDTNEKKYYFPTIS